MHNFRCWLFPFLKLQANWTALNQLNHNNNYDIRIEHTHTHTILRWRLLDSSSIINTWNICFVWQHEMDFIGRLWQFTDSYRIAGNPQLYGECWQSGQSRKTKATCNKDKLYWNHNVYYFTCCCDIFSLLWVVVLVSSNVCLFFQSFLFYQNQSNPFVSKRKYLLSKNLSYSFDVVLYSFMFSYVFTYFPIFSCIFHVFLCLHVFFFILSHFILFQLIFSLFIF